MNWDLLLEGGGLTFVVSVVVWLLTWFYRRVLGREKPGEDVLKTVVFLAAVVATYFTEPLGLPEFTGEPVEYALALLAQATLFFKAAQLWYDRIWRAVLEKVSPALFAVLALIR